jgi:hypothetical protein
LAVLGFELLALHLLGVLPFEPSKQLCLMPLVSWGFTEFHVLEATQKTLVYYYYYHSSGTCSGCSQI